MLNKTQIDDVLSVYTAKTANLNASILNYDDYCIVVDTMHLPKNSKQLQMQLTKPVKYIVNTHWHSDHIYGNRFIKQPNTLIVAQKKFNHTLKKEKAILNPKKAPAKPTLPLPEIIFDKTIILDNKLTLIHAPGHSFDSSLCYIHKSKILLAGDNVLQAPEGKISIPYFYWGNPFQHLKTLKYILKLNPKLIIPGHGKPVGTEKIKTDIFYLKNLLSMFEEFYTKNYKLSQNDFLQKAEQELNIDACLKSQNNQLWVYAMHALNLKKLYHDKQTQNLKPKN